MINSLSLELSNGCGGSRYVNNEDYDTELVVADGKEGKLIFDKFVWFDTQPFYDRLRITWDYGEDSFSGYYNVIGSSQVRLCHTGM